MNIYYLISDEIKGSRVRTRILGQLSKLCAEVDVYLALFTGNELQGSLGTEKLSP